MFIVKDWYLSTGELLEAFISTVTVLPWALP